MNPLNREEFWTWSDDDQRRFEFYRRFIKPDTLAFDVGANLGNRSKVFSKLGAFVVAIEPQTACARFLEVAFAGISRFSLIEKALGASVKHAVMHNCDAHTISSLSTDWIQAVQQSGRFAGYKWSQESVVSIETLDNLIRQFGSPDFIKIDVEGSESEVLLGLTTPVRALSFEFVPEYLPGAFSCIDQLLQLGPCRFQLSLGESMEFVFLDWVSAIEIKQALSNVPSADFGDVYVCFE